MENEGDSEYVIPPNIYEMFPKVQQATKVTTCDLGLWNLNQD